MPSLARALVDYDLDLLRVLAAQWDVDLASTDRAAASEQLAVAMTRPDAVRDTWQRLSPDEQEALVELQLNEGRLAFSHFTRRYGELRPMGPSRRERERPWRDPVSVTEALYYRGLVLRSFEHTPAGAQEMIAIPSDLAEVLPRPDPAAVEHRPGFAVAPPRKLKDGSRTAPDDVATLLAYLLLRDVDANEWLTADPVPAIDHYLRRPRDPAYRALLVQLAYDLGLVQDERTLTHVATRVNRDTARPWLEASRDHQSRSLAEAWLASAEWNDLAYTPDLEAEEWPNVPGVVRQVVLEAMQSVPAEIWWSANSLVDHIKEENPDFQRPGGDYSAWYLRDAHSGEILHGFEYWDYVEGALIRFAIFGPLRWLGLVRAAHGAFVLTALGLALLGRGPWPSAEDREVRIKVDDQGVIGVPAVASRYDRLQIARFAAWLETPGPTAYATTASEFRDLGIFQYRLTPQAIDRVIEEGVDILSHILPFLQRVTGGHVPSNVVKMLKAWHTEPREVIVHDTVVLSARDLGVYERLRDDKRISQYLGKQIGPHAHLVRRTNMPLLLDALRRLGVLPLFEGHEKDDSPL